MRKRKLSGRFDPLVKIRTCAPRACLKVRTRVYVWDRGRCKRMCLQSFDRNRFLTKKIPDMFFTNQIKYFSKKNVFQEEILQFGGTGNTIYLL